MGQTNYPIQLRAKSMTEGRNYDYGLNHRPNQIGDRRCRQTTEGSTHHLPYRSTSIRKQGFPARSLERSGRCPNRKSGCYMRKDDANLYARSLQAMWTSLDYPMTREERTRWDAATTRRNNNRTDWWSKTIQYSSLARYITHQKPTTCLCSKLIKCG